MKALDVDEDGNPQALQHVNVRLPRYVVEYFKRSTHYTAQIRKVLQDHAEKEKPADYTTVWTTYKAAEKGERQ